MYEAYATKTIPYNKTPPLNKFIFRCYTKSIDISWTWRSQTWLYIRTVMYYLTTRLLCWLGRCSVGWFMRGCGRSSIVLARNATSIDLFVSCIDPNLPHIKAARWSSLATQNWLLQKSWEYLWDFPCRRTDFKSLPIRMYWTKILLE